jgi:hypothetical protein
MILHPTSSRHALYRIALAALVSCLLLSQVHAQTMNGTTLTFMPHCILEPRTNCPTYDVLNASTITTPDVDVGDIVDVDVVLTSDTPTSAKLVRSWLSYDPTALDARNVELLPAVKSPIPGESTIVSDDSTVKIGGTVDGLTDQKTPIARVTFRIIAPRTSTITFKNYTPDGTKETAVLDGDKKQLMTTEPTTLRVAVKGSGAPLLSQSSSAMSSQPTMSGGTTAGSAFTILQVQNVRVTSKDDSLFIGWEPLRTNDLVGYNVYYGTISGRYIQRRSVDKNSTSLSIRGLEKNTQYFIAIRAFNTQSGESAFSDEASVVIGRPETSTAPLRTMGDDGVSPPNPVESRGGGNVSGETGMSSTVIMLIILSAIIGTAFAVRRQFSLMRDGH